MSVGMGEGPADVLRDEEEDEVVAGIVSCVGTPVVVMLLFFLATRILPPRSALVTATLLVRWCRCLAFSLSLPPASSPAAACTCASSALTSVEPATLSGYKSVL